MSEYSLNFSSISSNSDSIRVKWDNNGLLHRFSIDEGSTFADLLSKVQEIDPNFVGELGYTDDEGDLIIFSSTVELHELIAINRSLNCSTIKIKTIENDRIPPPLPPRSTQNFEQQNLNNFEKEIHPGIICDGCENSIIGIRYKCIVCDDFDLCENCEKKGQHSDHAMLRRVTPRTPMPAFIVANRLGFGGRRRPRFMQAFEGRIRPKCPRRRMDDLEGNQDCIWNNFSRRNYGEGFAGEPFGDDSRNENQNRESSNLTEAFRDAMARTAADGGNENEKLVHQSTEEDSGRQNYRENQNSRNSNLTEAFRDAMARTAADGGNENEKLVRQPGKEDSGRQNSRNSNLTEAFRDAMARTAADGGNENEKLVHQSTEENSGRQNLLQNQNSRSNDLTGAFRDAMTRTAADGGNCEFQNSENQLTRESEIEEIPLFQDSSYSRIQYDSSEILRNYFSKAYQTAQQAINQVTANPPSVEAAPAEKLAYNAAQAAQIAVAGLATASETLQKNVSILARDVENSHFKEAMNQLANVLATTNGNKKFFPKAPASTPANIASPMNNADPTTTPAEFQDQDCFDTVMESVSNNLNVVDLSTNHEIQKDTIMEESTHTAIEVTNDEKINFSCSETKISTECDEEMLDSMTSQLINENFYDVPESVTPIEDDNKTSVLSDIEVISMKDDDDDDESNILNPTEPRVISDGQVMLDAGDGWMVLSQGSYEEMCRFYEAQRRKNENNGSKQDVVLIVSENSNDEPTTPVAESAPENVQNSVQNSSQNPVQNPVQNPSQNLVQNPVQNPSQNLVQNPVQNPSQNPVQNPVQNPSQNPVQNVEFVQNPTATGNSTSVQPSAPSEPLSKEPEKVETAPQPPPRSGTLYPELEEPCEAGTPYYQMTNYYQDYKHTRQCPIEHPNRAIQAAVDTLVLELGFDNCNGWITHLSEKCNGEIDAILNEMEKDPVYIRNRSH